MDDGGDVDDGDDGDDVDDAGDAGDMLEAGRDVSSRFVVTTVRHGRALRKTFRLVGFTARSPGCP
ncbi:hypothetical protein EF906_27220 [Streptomyces sp. WAC08241]|nr:hypothetical protein EF906_27220 [Streptomyces sp. WAC08241]